MKGKEKCGGWRRTSVTAGILLIAVALFIAVTPAMAEEADVTVTANAPDHVDVEEDTFFVTIDVDSVTDLNSAYFYLSFDKSVVKVSDVEDGKIGGEKVPIMWKVNPDKDTVGVVINMPPGEGVSGSGHLAEIEFEVEGEEGEKSELKFSEGELAKVPEGYIVSAEMIPANWINATVTIGQPTPEEDDEEEDEEEDEEPMPTPTLEPGVTPSPTPETNVTETIGTAPTPALAPGETPAPTPTLAPGETPLRETTPVKKTTPKPTAPLTTEEKTTPTATPKPEEPGFEAVFAIVGLVAIAYILLRNR